ncbi:MAG TPA: hypothetical protein VNI81_15685 [Candidatus Limnocylindrales bacterium]|nr:hypothetical protein [Candidatus Limnocylindrales bacterium]
MPRTRTTKTVAQRIDLNYFKRSTPFKRARLILVILAPLLAIGWIAWRGFSRDSRVYSSGHMSEPHAVLDKQCAACHVQKTGEFSAKAAEIACLSCHDGPMHHENQVRADVPNCATCHMEHRGRVNIVAGSNISCSECHSHLKVSAGNTLYATGIRTLEDGHPEIAALRKNAKDPGTILLNHSIHMKPIRRGPNGPLVQMECADCHRPETVKASWPYADANYVDAKVTYDSKDVLLPVKAGTLQPRHAMGRSYMAPVKFSTTCAACHLLTFDKHFDIGVPHDKPDVVHAFVVKKFQEYIAAHPADVRVGRDPQRDLTGKPLPPEVRILTPAQWVAERTADAEELLWRKTCKQCHSLTVPKGASLPRLAEANLTERWMPHARFDHDAHRGFSCVGCHPAALSSKETSDVLVPPLANCKTCHAPGPDHAESRCFECHTYHDWSKRKEVKPTYLFPGLKTGGM